MQSSVEMEFGVCAENVMGRVCSDSMQSCVESCRKLISVAIHVGSSTQRCEIVPRWQIVTLSHEESPCRRAVPRQYPAPDADRLALAWDLREDASGAEGLRSARLVHGDGLQRCQKGMDTLSAWPLVPLEK